MVIAVTWILFPRDLENRGHFLGAILASLAHPYPWIGLSYVTLTTARHYVSHHLVLLIGGLDCPTSHWRYFPAIARHHGWDLLLDEDAHFNSFAFVDVNHLFIQPFPAEVD